MARVPHSPAPLAGPASSPGEPDALVQAVAALMRPLAQLAVSKGVPFAAIEAQLKRAFVDAGREAHPQLPLNRAVSRIATATGLNRRDVTRLTQAAAPPPARRHVASEVFARWTSDPAYRTQRGQPRVLPRQGDAPSFESLAQSVTRDVHPRSLLDELQRLGLAQHDTARDTVSLMREAFVPRGDAQRMYGFLGSNVGDHLAAAVANVLGDGSEHFAQSLEAMREIVATQWRAIVSTLVPQIQALIDQDRASGRARDSRLRIGLYTFTDRMDRAQAPAPLSSPTHTNGLDRPS
jgi:hypothetical protein